MMGQKVNPIVQRLNINREWEAKWFTKNKDIFASYIKEDCKIRSYFSSIERNSQIVKVNILRSSNTINIHVFSCKPGILIGKKGAGAEHHISKLRSLLGCDKVFVDVKEVRDPYLHAAYVANDICGQIENRMTISGTMQRAAKHVMAAKALGVKIIISGRLYGADIARSESVVKGNVALHVFRNNISYALRKAHTLYGIIGVKVYINKPTKRFNHAKTPKT